MKRRKQLVQMIQGFRGQDVWVRKVEHIVLRVVSLGFSLASAHAIRWFFAPLDGIDTLQPIITWTVAIGFGVLGYIVSRGVAHRLMNKERIRAYAPICAVVEIVEIFCNYALAAAVIQRATWLQVIPANQRAVLTAFTYLVLSIIPLVSLLLAVVDMDLERSKRTGVGGVPIGNGIGSPFLNGNRGPVYGPPVMQPMRLQAQANPQGQPKDASLAGIQGYPTYTQGYGGSPAVMASESGVGSSQQMNVVQQPGGILSGIPFLGKRQAPPPTTVLPSTP
jgi:hypothetical protein